MRIAFIGNQGGEQVFDFYSAMAATLVNNFDHVEPVFAVWLEREKVALGRDGWFGTSVHTFESWVRRDAGHEAEVGRIREQYREVNWSAVVAAERNFTDYSQLLGSAGERRESAEYVQKLVVNMVTFFEALLTRERVQAVVCQTADTLFSLVVFKVAAHFDVKVYAISPAWLLEPGCEGGFFVKTEFLETTRMVENYERIRQRELTAPEIERVEALMHSIKTFEGKTAFHSKMKGAKPGMSALSPNIPRLISYLRENASKDKDIEYIKVDPMRKLRGNLLRVWRKYWARSWLGPPNTTTIPPRSIFYAIHFQPEQSTLAQGIYHVNQVALIEDISKSLPLGYTLVVKEHPWGRGSRPLWQYKHLASLYNVTFCDAPAKAIVREVDAVIAVTGTIALEALVLDKPTVVLGKSFFNHADLLYCVSDVKDLPEVLKRILVDGEYAAIPDRHARLGRFLLSYLESLIPYFPTIENAEHYAYALATELNIAARADRRTSS